MSAKDSGWWEDFFPAFRPVFGKISPKQTNAQVRFIMQLLDLRSGKKFLDCPCGIGRISLPMAKAGIKVTGVDITDSYLEELKRKAAHRNLKITLKRADMRRVKYDSEFDAAGNIWTSFGYFEKESDNLLVLKRMYRALKPGGKFLLHVINRDWLMANFQSSDWYYAGDVKILEQRGFDYETSVSTDTWTLIRDGEETNYYTAIRMYSYHELLAMFRQVGFVDVKGCASVKGEPITRESMYMFVVGTKPD